MRYSIPHGVCLSCSIDEDIGRAKQSEATVVCLSVQHGTSSNCTVGEVISRATQCEAAAARVSTRHGVSMSCATGEGTGRATRRCAAQPRAPEERSNPLTVTECGSLPNSLFSIYKCIYFNYAPGACATARGTATSTRPEL